MHRVRDFLLVLCADVWDQVVWYTVRILKEAMAAEKARGGFDDFFSESKMVYSPRASRPEIAEEWRIDYAFYWTPL